MLRRTDPDLAAAAKASPWKVALAIFQETIPGIQRLDWATPENRIRKACQLPRFGGPALRPSVTGAFPSQGIKRPGPISRSPFSAPTSSDTGSWGGPAEILGWLLTYDVTAFYHSHPVLPQFGPVGQNLFSYQDAVGAAFLNIDLLVVGSDYVLREMDYRSPEGIAERSQSYYGYAQLADEKIFGGKRLDGAPSPADAYRIAQCKAAGY